MTFFTIRYIVVKKVAILYIYRPKPRGYIKSDTMKNRLLFKVLILTLMANAALVGQPLSVQLQVGEEKTLGERLGNCVTAGSYLVYPNLDSPLVFVDDEVSMSTFGVFASFSVRAPFDADPGNYIGEVIYEIFEVDGSLCFIDTLFLEIEVTPAMEPIPEFKTFPRVVVEGGTVEFENLSQNPVEEWLWDFGDGATSTEKTPSNTYNTSGKYTVSLTAMGPGGSATATKEEYIEVVEPGTPGQSIWTFKMDGIGAKSPAIGKDNTIYISSGGGVFHAIDSNGNEKWSSNSSIHNRPVIGNSGIIYGSSGDKLFALHSTGSIKWQFDAGDNITNGIFALGIDETAYVGTGEGKLIAIDSSGIEKWSLNLEASTVFNPIIGSDGTIYTLASFGADAKVFAISPSGTIRWVYEEGSISSLQDLSINRSGNLIIAGNPVVALDYGGQVLWEQSLPGFGLTSQVVYDKAGNMYGTAGDITGSKVYSFTPNKEEPNWVLDLESYIPPPFDNDLSAPLIGSDGTIYCYTKAGLVFAINPFGEILWVHSLVPDDFEPNNYYFNSATPAMDAQGTLYISYDDNALHAISTDSPGLLNDVWSKSGQNNQNTRSFPCLFPVLIFPIDTAENQAISTPFTWYPVSSSTAYEIEISKDSAFLEIVRTEVITDISAQLELEYGNHYYWRVRSVLENGEKGCWSAIRSFSTQIAPPSQPNLIAPTNGDAGIPLASNFSWTSIEGADSYQIQIARDIAFTSLEKDEIGLTETTASFLLPEYQTIYYWRVKAINASGESDWSEIWSFSTQIAPPTQPNLIAPTNGSAGIPLASSFSWTSIEGADSYQIQIARDNAFTSLEKDESDLTETTASFLLPEYQTIYYWRVKAINASGESDWSETWNFTTEIISDVKELESKYGLKVYPNPAMESIFIEFSSPWPLDADLMVFNSTGAMMKATKKKVYLGYNRIEINLQSLSCGTYYYRLIGQNIKLYGKFVKTE